MILSKKVYVTINAINKVYFQNLGYDNLIVGKKSFVLVKHLKPCSHAIVEVRCDICGKQELVKFKNYKKNIMHGGYYSCNSTCKSNKIKNTNLKKYGAEWSLQNDKIQLERKITNFNKYGFEYATKNEIIKEKTKKTNLKKYGVEYHSQNKEIKEKIKATNLQRYGVTCTSQIEEVFHKQQISATTRKFHKLTGLYYQGTYEKHFLDFCFENNISIKKGKTIKYFFENKKRIYFSDFYIESNNLIVEIKSSYYYKKHLYKNLAKQKSCLEQGYNFIFIINKIYDEFLKLINNKDCS